MIIHTIVKNKPHLTARQMLTNFGNAALRLVAPLPTKSSNQLVHHQGEYNEYLNDIHISSKTYVTSARPNAVRSRFQIYYVKDIETDFEKIPSWSPAGIPCCVQMIGIWGEQKFYTGDQLFFEWHTGRGYRELTEGEMQEYIDDNVRNYIAARITAYLSE